MSKTKKLLVTGASGFLGWNVCRIAQPQWQVYGTYFSQTVEIAGAMLIKADLRDLTALRELLAAIKPDAIIHAAAASKPNFCQQQPQPAYEINVTATVNLAELAGERGVPLVFTSTDLVFDGSRAPYRETDPVAPLSFYGEQKALAEQEILQRYPQAATCRMPLMFGSAPTTASSFIQPFIKSLRERKALKLFTDEYRTPVSAAIAVQGLLLALEKASGLLHLGGKERVSRHEFGGLLAQELGLPKELIEPCLQRDVPMAAPRPADVSLDSRLAFSLGYEPPSLTVQLAALQGQV